MAKNKTKTKAKRKSKKPANDRGSFKFVGIDGKKYRLTPKQHKFALAYLEFKGNGISAVYEAGYSPKNARVASAIAYENLTKPHISAFIDLKLEEYGYTDENVKKQHLFLINQFADLKSKKSAIDMFYKLRGEYAPEKHKHEAEVIVNIVNYGKKKNESKK